MEFLDVRPTFINCVKVLWVHPDPLLSVLHFLWNFRKSSSWSSIENSCSNRIPLFLYLNPSYRNSVIEVSRRRRFFLRMYGLLTIYDLEKQGRLTKAFLNLTETLTKYGLLRRVNDIWEIMKFLERGEDSLSFLNPDTTPYIKDFKINRRNYQG